MQEIAAVPLSLSLSHECSSMRETAREKLTKILRERITTSIYLDTEHHRCYWCLSLSSCDIDFDGTQLQVVSFFFLSFPSFFFFFSFPFFSLLQRIVNARTARVSRLSALKIYLEHHSLRLSHLYTYLLWRWYLKARYFHQEKLQLSPAVERVSAHLVIQRERERDRERERERERGGELREL